MKNIIYSSLLFLGIFILSVSACKKQDEHEPNIQDTTNLGFDPQLTPAELQVLEDASVNYDDFLDSLFDINGVSYRTIFSDPNWNNKMDSLKTLLKTTQVSVSQQIKLDINSMLLFGGGLVNENRIAANIRPELSSEEPAQQAYAYLQVPANERQIETRVLPVFGNTIYKQYKLLGIDCSGYLSFLLKSAGFTNANFTFSQGTFQTKIPASVKQKYSNNAELINLGNLQASKLKKGDFMVWPGHGAIIDVAGANPLAYQSNGTSNPANEADHKKNFEYSGPNVKRGISAKDYNWLKTYIGQSIDIYRIVPIIDKGEIVSGNNQSGAENQNLSQPLKVKVLDKTGFGIPEVKVVFSVTSGGGQLIGNAEALTNDDGVAQITWKLGTQASGTQKVQAKVKKFTEVDLGGTDIIFNATIGGGCGSTTSVTDIDGNVYPVVQIGNQCWTKENLKTTKFADGSVIPNITDGATWLNLTTPAWCIYNNNSGNDAVYGKLYNWYTVADPRNLCPTGWHVPTDGDWTTLTDYLGGESVAGGKMKATVGWNAPNTGATDESGFSGLSAGCLSPNGTFNFLGSNCYWWRSSELSDTMAWNCALININDNVARVSVYKKGGISVRCVKD